jgi:hypothetical protein
MKMLTIEILDENATKLIENLESLHLVKIVKWSNEPKEKKPSDYFDILSKEEGNIRLQQLNESRSEWEVDT